MEQKELVDIEFGRTMTSFEKYAVAWREISNRSRDRSGEAAYAHLKDLMYTSLADDCRVVHRLAPGESEKDRVAEEAAELAELKRKGLLNQKISDRWQVTFIFVGVLGIY